MIQRLAALAMTGTTENRAIDMLRRGEDCRRIVRSLNYPVRAPR